MKPANPVTGDNAILFDSYVVKWQARLNLGDWRIERGGKPAKNAMASVEVNPPARLATYRLGDFGSEEISPVSLEKTAIHELLHVLLHDLLVAATGKTTDEELETQEHRVVNILERLLAGQA